MQDMLYEPRLVRVERFAQKAQGVPTGDAMLYHFGGAARKQHVGLGRRVKKPCDKRSIGEA